MSPLAIGFGGDRDSQDLADARQDPRAKTEGKPAALLDFFAALREIERNVMTTRLGLAELALVDATDERRGTLRPETAGQRAEFARIEIANDYPYLHSNAICSLHHALDTLVRTLVPVATEMVQKAVFDHISSRLEDHVASELESLDEASRDAITQAVRGYIDEELVPGPERPIGPISARYEEPLSAVHLGEREDAPIPSEMKEALSEILQLRNAMVHNAGRVNAKMLARAPSLRARYGVGDLVRPTSLELRRYYAATNVYAAEIMHRFGRDFTEPPDLEQWTLYRPLGM